jgi:hypothetical protein
LRNSLCLGIPLLIGALAVSGDSGGLVPIFDGKSLEGWHPAHEPGHGSGCLWMVKDGEIRGIQQSPGEWGILGTAQRYGDFELRLEVKTEWPFDAGVLLRSTMEGHGYEVLLHASPGGDVGGIAASRIGDERVPGKDGLKAWKKDAWNEVRIEVKGQPAVIRTWINGRPTAELRSELKDVRVGPEGHVALKIHADESSFRSPILFRNIGIRELKK